MPQKTNNPIDPIQGRLLVELRSKFKHIKNPTEERFGTSKTRGVVRAIAPDIVDKCNKELNIEVGDWVYFGKYEDTAPYPIGANEYILIKLEEIDGRGDAD